MSSSAPAQARACPAANGLRAPSKMARESAWMGSPHSLAVSWIEPRAVRSRGAVSPAARAMASMTPVVIPGAADGMITLVTVCHLAAPRP